MGLAVDGANRHDMKLVRATVDSLPVPRPAPSPDQPQGMCLDKGYDFDEVRRTLDEFGFTAHIRSRGEEAKAIKREAGFKARRWVVERSHSWLKYETDSLQAKWEELTETLDATERDRLIREIGNEKFDNFEGIPLLWIFFQVAIDPNIIAEYKFPGTAASNFSHLETITAVKQ